MYQPKGNGINAWSTVDDLIDTAGAGYVDEDLFYSFMPEAFGCRALALAGFYSTADAAANFAFLFYFFVDRYW